MTFLHAIVQIEHHVARVLQFDAEDFGLRKIAVHRHDTSRRADVVRPEHEFFADVCDSLEEMSMVLVVGAHAAHADLRRYVDRHQRALHARIIGWEAIDHPTEGQLLALARRDFTARERVLVPSMHG